jgi:hypothetical protein
MLSPVSTRVGGRSKKMNQSIKDQAVAAAEIAKKKILL